jgi:histidine ammonia-lyase
MTRSRAGIAPVTLAEKEGLALINGTDGMLGMLVLAIDDLRRLLKVADITAAMSVEGLLGTDDVFADDLQALATSSRPGRVGSNLRNIMATSEIRESHRTEACTRVRTRIRCAARRKSPVPSRDTVAHAGAGRLDRARLRHRQPGDHLDGRVSPTATSTVHLSAMCWISSPSRWQTWPASPNGEPTVSWTEPVAVPQCLPGGDPGVDSGHMIAQYTQAAIVSELKRLAVPASVDSIPSSAMQEDHVSMGLVGGAQVATRHRWADSRARDRAAHAARGIELRLPLQPAPGQRRRLSPRCVPPVRRFRHGSLARARDRDRCSLVASGAVVAAVESVTGTSQLIKEKETLRMEGARPVRAPRGTTLTARSWPPRPRCGC